LWLPEQLTSQTTFSEMALTPDVQDLIDFAEETGLYIFHLNFTNKVNNGKKPLIFLSVTLNVFIFLVSY